MNVRLPSRGKMGVHYIEMRMPRLGDLRDSSELSFDETQAKTEFLLKLIENKDEFFKISTYDRDYLFVLAAGSILLNNFGFKYTCRCGFTQQNDMQLDQCAVETLSDDFQTHYEKEIFGKTYEFNMPTVLSELQMFKWVYSVDEAVNGQDPEADESDKKILKDRLEDGSVCMILGWEVNDENIEKVRNLDLGVYWAAMYYYQTGFHGVKTQKVCRCKNCGRLTRVTVPVLKNILTFDTKEIITRFVKMQKSIDFNSFMNLTIPEYISIKNAQPI